MGYLSARCKLFQSTLPQGERLDIFENFCATTTLFQSTLPQGERRTPEKEDLVQMYISIHAPARGATLSPVLVRAKDIFQSTLPQGERREFLEVPEGGELFQSTLPQGERPRINHSNLCYMIISIHAPARGATRILHLRYLLCYLFQSTLPQGERRCPLVNFHFHLMISIHAPARGATTFLLRTRRYFIISIHAPARGATQLQELRQDLIDYFNPRSRKGSDNGPIHFNF